MGDYQTDPPATQLEELIFNDEQEAKVGAALQALADQITSTARCSAPRKVQKEVIELLSDSDSDEITVSKSATEKTLKIKEEDAHHDNKTGTKENSIVLQQAAADDSVKTNMRLLASRRHPSTEKKTSEKNNLPKYLSVAEFLEDECDTLSECSEGSDTQYKFKYEQEPEPVKTPKYKETLPPSSTAYITLTDITGEEIQVEEINVQHFNEAANEDDEVVELTEDDKQNGLGEADQQHQYVEAKQDALSKQDLQVQYEDAEVDIDVNSEESLLQAKQEIDVEEPYMQQYCKEEIIDKPDYYSNDNISIRNSLDDSNGLTTMYGTDLLNNYDETDEDIVELSDLAAEQIMINLVDSDTESEQETTEYNTSTNESLLEAKPSTTSIDCFMNYTCPQCSIECGSFGDWKLHTDAEHKFSTIDALNMQTIIDKEGHLCYQCRDCEQKFELHMTFHKLLPHRFKHLPNEEYIRCRLCELSFRNKSTMRRHLVKRHYKICREYLNIPKQKRPNVLAMKYIKIKCPICNQPQTNRKQWRDHLEDMHDFSTNIMTHVNLLSNNVYKCTLCEVKMRKRSILDHMLTHEKYKSFACTLCNKYEAGQFMLALNHVRRVHIMSEKELLYKCNYCEATFEKMSHRKKHLRLKHKVKWQKCAICHKEFFSISLLLSHMNFANHHKLK